MYFVSGKQCEQCFVSVKNSPDRCICHYNIIIHTIPYNIRTYITILLTVVDLTQSLYKIAPTPGRSGTDEGNRDEINRRTNIRDYFILSYVFFLQRTTHSFQR